MLKFCDVAIRAGQPDRAAETLRGFLADPDPLPEQVLVRIFTLGEQLGLSDVSAGAIRALAGFETLSPGTALMLLRRAHGTGDAALRGHVADTLAQRLPPAQRAEFGVAAASLSEGPEAALTLARQEMPSPRFAAQCTRIGQCLLSAGRAQLALRYLRLCLRRWPGATRLRSLAVEACLRSGELDQGQAILDAEKAAEGAADIGQARLRVLIEGGRLEEALALDREAASRGWSTLPHDRLLRLYLTLGRLDDATRAAAALNTSPGRSRAAAAHFGPSHLGALLNELRLYRWTTAQGDPPPTDRDLAEGYFYPAQRILDAMGDRSGPDDAPPIPHRVLQYWDTEPPPPEVAEVLASWKSAPGFEHLMHNRASARAFLLETFDRSHAQAFRMTRNVSEECDFLRLCLLYHHGGIYADADDRRMGDPRDLLAEGRDLIVFREPFGALANNVICAAPGHPALGLAIRMARQSLLARENDGTWSKTGPGLLTRAVAIYLHDSAGDPDARGVSIVPRHRLNRHVQAHVRLSYKSTVKHWNGQDFGVAEPVTQALYDLGDEPPGSTAGD